MNFEKSTLAIFRKNVFSREAGSRDFVEIDLDTFILT